MNQSAPHTCPICKLEASKQFDGRNMHYECRRCGRYAVTEHAIHTLIADQALTEFAPSYVISGAIRGLSDRGIDVVVSRQTLPDILASVRIPRTPIESIDLLLEQLMRRGSRSGDEIELQPQTDYPVVFARNEKEFTWFVVKARQLGYLEPGLHKSAGLTIDFEGWRRLAEIGQLDRNSPQAFVAMWFDPSLDDCWANGIKLAIEDAGYVPLRIDKKPHNEKIDDRIIAEIRRSGLLIADFTGQRAGVYFEAGFAKGLGLEVIFTVHEDDVNNLHFDTRQYNHIVWSTPKDLRERLKYRILATAPRAEDQASL